MRFLFSCLLLSAACAGAASAPENGATGSGATAVPDGRWGGEHAALEASAAGATIRFDCAHGSTSARLTLDREGRFDLAGDFVKEHGGPIRKNEAEDRRRARYRGRVKDGTMTLTVEVEGESAPIGPFTLERGSDGHVVRCR